MADDKRHSWRLIEGEVDRAYYESSPARDIYKCEHCGSVANSVYAVMHPDEVCSDQYAVPAMRTSLAISQPPTHAAIKRNGSK